MGNPKGVEMRNLESQEFYELMQTYRHTPIEKQTETVEAYNAVKDYILIMIGEIFANTKLWDIFKEAK